MRSRPTLTPSVTRACERARSSNLPRFRHRASRAGIDHRQFAQDRKQYARRRPSHGVRDCPTGPLHAVDREGPRSLQTPSRGHAGGSADNRLGALATGCSRPTARPYPDWVTPSAFFCFSTAFADSRSRECCRWRKTFGRSGMCLLSRRHTACNWRGRMQRLIQILDNVLRVFDSDAEPNGFRAHACAKLLVLGHLSMGR